MEKSGLDTCLDAPLDTGELVAEAGAIARQILERRFCAKDGSVVWLGPVTSASGKLVRLSPVGPYLYSGSTGISLFLAAFGRLTGSQEHCDIAIDAIRPLRTLLGSILADPVRAGGLCLGVGGLTGLGSLVYAFRKVGQLLDAPDLICESQDLVGLFTPELISRDQFRDVVAGSAGAILSLLSLTELYEKGSTIESAAMACARNLLASRLSIKDRPAGWRTLPGCPPLSGFAHGAAGICYSLLRLYELTEEVGLLEAAREGLAFEEGLYSKTQRNWKDLRQADSSFVTAWCHGAPGIALGRIGAINVEDTPNIRADISVALETTLTARLNKLDHVCCGNMGRAEILLYASQKLRDLRFYSAAQRLVAQVIGRARSKGHFGWMLDPRSSEFDPSFFTGASGVGYSLLRLAKPDSLPCIMAFE